VVGVVVVTEFLIFTFVTEYLEIAFAATLIDTQIECCTIMGRVFAFKLH